MTAWTFFYGLFYIDYGPHEHVLSDVQRWYRRKIDGMLGIDARAIKQISDSRESTDSNVVSGGGATEAKPEGHNSR